MQPANPLGSQLDKTPELNTWTLEVVEQFTHCLDGYLIGAFLMLPLQLSKPLV